MDLQERAKVPSVPLLLTILWNVYFYLPYKQYLHQGKRMVKKATYMHWKHVTQSTEVIYIQCLF